MIYPRLSPLPGFLDRPSAARHLETEGRTMVNVAGECIATKRRRDVSDALQFRLLYATCFGVFLVSGLLMRLLAWIRFAGARRAERQSIFQQARNSAGLCATYAFMG